MFLPRPLPGIGLIAQMTFPFMATNLTFMKQESNCGTSVKTILKKVESVKSSGIKQIQNQHLLVHFLCKICFVLKLMAFNNESLLTPEISYGTS